jgi:hippurate hydrolase
VDPIVIAARTVLALQTIVSREISPFDPAVITVGAIHGGTRENIIPEEVQLQLTVRSFTPAVRQHLLDGIGRVAKAEAAAAAAPREPLIERRDGANAQVNDPLLAQRVGAALLRELGPERAQEAPPEMIAEDFSEYQAVGVATLMLRLGTVEPSRLKAAKKTGEVLPSLHSARFAPDLDATLSTAITAEVIALRELLRQ